MCAQTQLLRRPTGLADGLALKEPALPRKTWVRPENLVPPFPAPIWQGLGFWLGYERATLHDPGDGSFRWPGDASERSSKGRTTTARGTESDAQRRKRG